MKMIHCINQPTTGEAQSVQFVDGFQAAGQLKVRHPEHYRLLTTTRLDFRNEMKNSHVLSRHPTIKLDVHGDIVQIHYSTRHRDSFTRLSLDEVEPVYKALKSFSELLYDKENIVEIQLNNDIVYCFNNWRILHGRKAIKLVPGSEPKIERGYVDWDELHSSRRVLKVKLGISDEEY
jgi:gamma-butyrobetaine dioxygenase